MRRVSSLIALFTVYVLVAPGCRRNDDTDRELGVLSAVQGVAYKLSLDYNPARYTAVEGMLREVDFDSGGPIEKRIEPDGSATLIYKPSAEIIYVNSDIKAWKAELDCHDPNRLIAYSILRTPEGQRVIGFDFGFHIHNAPPSELARYIEGDTFYPPRPK